MRQLHTKHNHSALQWNWKEINQKKNTIVTGDSRVSQSLDALLFVVSARIDRYLVNYSNVRRLKITMQICQICLLRGEYVSLEKSSQRNDYAVS